MNRTDGFDVDLGALIEVLGRNLYSSPGVYVRELLQNAIDAQTVAGRRDAEIALHTDGAEFTIVDHGVGMDAERIGALLGTIGGSSKRDALGFSHQDTIGQFGVGMLSGFLIGDRIEVSSRADGAAPVRWTGSADGGVTVRPGDRETTGTTVRIRVRPGMECWLSPERVTGLAAAYTALHPTPVSVNGAVVNRGADPLTDDGSGALAAARVAYCQDEFGFTPLDSFEVAVPEVGLRGVAYVFPEGAGPMGRVAHRMYLKGLLVGDVAELLPEWAYFVRLVVEAQHLTPTASREGLVRDDALTATADSLAAQVTSWLIGLEQRPALRATFLAVHGQGIKALAAHRRELLGFVDRNCDFETNFGPMPLASFRARYGTIRHTDSVDDFRMLADILAGRGVGLVNSGYAFESAVIAALVAADAAVTAEFVTQEVLLSALGAVDPQTRATMAETERTAARALAAQRCEVALASFEPAGISAVYVTDDAAKLAADRKKLLSETAGEPDAWLAALSAVDAAESAGPVRESSPVLVLNVRNPLVQRLPQITDTTVAGAMVRVLYGQALIRARRSLRLGASGDIDDAITLLADLATRSAAPEGTA